MWDLNDMKCVQSIDLSKNSLRLFSYLITDICCKHNVLTLCTEMGDIAQIKVETNSTTIRRMEGIDSVKGSIRALAMVHMDFPCIIVGGESGYVYMYDILNHYLVHSWKIGQYISALAAIYINRNIILSVATINGAIIFYENYDELPRESKCSDRSIYDLSFSPDGQFVSAACADRCIYLYQFKDGSYMSYGKRTYNCQQTREGSTSFNIIFIRFFTTSHFY